MKSVKPSYRRITHFEWWDMYCGWIRYWNWEKDDYWRYKNWWNWDNIIWHYPLIDDLLKLIDVNCGWIYTNYVDENGVEKDISYINYIFSEFWTWRIEDKPDEVKEAIKKFILRFKK